MIERRFALLLLCFFISGLAGLVYQTAWAQQFSLVFGATEQAVVTVLAAYMAGLALGASWAGRRAPGWRRPLLVYALIELGIGLAALAVPFAIDLIGRWQVALFAGHELSQAAASAGSALFYLVSSFAILLVPTALMGATLPLLTQWAVREEAEIGSRVGSLYAANTAGAALGTVAAAFVLLPSLGLGRTLGFAVAMNLLVFGAAAWLARRAQGRPGPRPETRGSGIPHLTKDAARDVTAAAAAWVILPLMLASGIVSFTWEVLWTRLLAQLLGGSVYAFATMLATFLAGIALGAALAARLATDSARSATAFASMQLAVGVLSLASFALVDRLAELARPVGAEGQLLHGALLAAAVLLPGATAIGGTFPLAVRILARDSATAARASARVFAWNTAGAILGATLAGYLFLPVLRFAGTATAAAAASGLVAVAAAWLLEPRRRLIAALAAGALGLLALRPPATPWKTLLYSPLSGEGNPGEVTHFAVGRSATVLLTATGVNWRLTSNGLPESAIEGRAGRAGRHVVARWLSLLPLLAQPQARSLLVVGLGAGTTVEDLPATYRQAHVVELEAEVLRANRRVAAGRLLDPLQDPRVRVHLNDARGALRLAGRRFDAIVSQPSHPWTSGASNLFTTEFLTLVRDRLEPSGAFVQWMGLPFVDEALLRSFLRTASDVFPQVELYRPVPGAVLLLASTTPFEASERAGEALEAARAQWAVVGSLTVEDILAARVLDDAGVRALAHGHAPSRDYLNLFRTRSAGALRRPLGAAGASSLLAAHDPLLSSLVRATDEEILVYARRLIRQRDAGRARRLAEVHRDASIRPAILGLAELDAGRWRKAARYFRAALRSDPHCAAARQGLLLLAREPIARGQPAPALGGGSTASESLLVDAWRLMAAGDWQRLRRLDGQLDLPPRHGLFAAARRLRAQWRIASGDRLLALEALELLTPLLAPQPKPGDLLRRAAAAAAAGRPRVALAAIGEALNLPPRPGHGNPRPEARRLLRPLENDPRTAAWLSRLLEQADGSGLLSL